MYWSIRLDYDSQSITNFFFNHHVYSFEVLPMGFKNACFVGQSASELTYSQQTMLNFLKYKNWTLNSDNWPFSDISEILIVYIDDIAIFSPNNIPNSEKIHGNLLEFVFFATLQYGFKIGKNKFEPFVKNFRFLGHQFDVERGCTMIPPSKVELFRNFRSPRSTAETLSRLSILSYYRKYIPLFKIIVQPLHQMAMSGSFEWQEKHQLAWKATLLLATLGFANHVIDRTRCLF